MGAKGQVSVKRIFIKENRGGEKGKGWGGKEGRERGEREATTLQVRAQDG